MKNHVQLFKALADETRLLLYAQGELCVFLLPQSTVSRHLAYLKRSAMVCDRREGLWIYYSMNHGHHLLKAMAPFLQKSLRESSVAANDQQRLLSYRKEHNCISPRY